MLRRVLASFVLLFPTTAVTQSVPTYTGSVVVTAAGEEQPEGEVSAAATVIEAEELRASGAVSAAEALRRVPGTLLLRSGGDTDVASLFVRGTNSAQTLVLFDGVRLNSPYFGGYDWSLPMTSGLDRIEVVRGPYSALYGADALGGVVQMVPARAEGTRLRALLEGGGDGWRRGELEGAVRAGVWDALISAATRDGSGTLDNDDFSSRSVMADLGMRVGGEGRLGVLVRRTASRTEIPFAGPRVTPDRWNDAEETLAALPLRFATGVRSDLEVVISRVERDLAFRDPDDPDGFTSSDTAADATGARAVWRTTLGAHRVTVGGEWQRDEVSDASSYGLNLDAERQTTRSLFVQDRAPLGGGFEIVAGARWDEAGTWGQEVSPRATLAWRRDTLRLWTSFGRAFRAPSLGELTYPWSGNPDLRPERSRSAELGASVPVPALGGEAQVVVFANRIDDMIEFDFSAYRFGNVSSARQDGVEASWANSLAGGTMRFGVTWLEAADGKGESLLRRARWSGSAVWSGALPLGVSGEASLVFVGARDDLDPVSFSRVRQESFVTASAALERPIFDWLAVRLRLDNLLDRSYEEVRGYPAPGRRVFVGVETAVH
ncbi:MAG: TonB-dependent receptor [Acidobacteriota bacterium]